VIVEEERLRAELVRACGDAELDPGAVVVWVVDAVRPPGATPIAYLQPAGEVRADTVLVFRAVGAGRAEAHRLAAHRLALWRSLPGLPDAALGPMLRHELEHARRWERSGVAFYEADERLRALAGPDDYARLPTEREANAAAGAYARRALAPAELDALRRVPELAGLLAAEPPADVVAETAALLRARLGEDGAAPAPAALAPPRRAEPLVEVVHPVEAPA